MRRTGETARQCSIAPKHALAAALGLVALAGTLSITRAADCPPESQQHLPQAPPPPLNIDKVKDVLLAYQAENYDGDVAAVFAAARAYIEGRAGQVSKPALVLDIDETSLSNWSNLKANNFGFIADGACDRFVQCGESQRRGGGFHHRPPRQGTADDAVESRPRRVRRLGQARHPPRRRPTSHGRSLQDRGTSQARAGRLHDHRDRRRPAERSRRRFRRVHVQGAKSFLLYSVTSDRNTLVMAAIPPCRRQARLELVRRAAIALEVGVLEKAPGLFETLLIAQDVALVGVLRGRKFQRHGVELLAALLENVASDIGAQERRDVWIIIYEGLVRGNEERARRIVAVLRILDVFHECKIRIIERLELLEADLGRRNRNRSPWQA